MVPTVHAAKSLWCQKSIVLMVHSANSPDKNSPWYQKSMVPKVSGAKRPWCRRSGSVVPTHGTKLPKGSNNTI